MDLEVGDVRMICISYLEIAGAPAHLRYLLRRLRQRAPDAPILAGLWPADDTILKEEKLRAVVGADYYVTSLREAVQRCLEAAIGTAPPDELAGRKDTPAPARETERAPLPA
jgi:hypothetical protein